MNGVTLDEEEEVARHFENGKQAYNAKQFHKAAKEFSLALLHGINDNLKCVLWLWKGHTLSKIPGCSLDDTIYCFDKVIELNPELVSAFNAKAWVLDRVGLHELAVECYARSLTLNPMDAKALCNKGFSYDKCYKHEEALRCYNRALEIKPECFSSLNNKGACLNFLGRYEEAIACLTQAYRLNPVANPLTHLGLAQCRIGQLRVGMQNIMRALKLNTSYPNGWYNRGAILVDYGWYQLAKECFERATAVDELHEPAKWALNQLTSMTAKEPSLKNKIILQILKNPKAFSKAKLSVLPGDVIQDIETAKLLQVHIKTDLAEESQFMLT